MKAAMFLQPTSSMPSIIFFKWHPLCSCVRRVESALLKKSNPKTSSKGQLETVIFSAVSLLSFPSIHNSLLKDF